MAADAVGNWLWLADLPRRERALDLGGGGAMALGLARHFDRVEHHDADPVRRAASRARVEAFGAVSVDAPSGDYDCVTVHGDLRRLATPSGSARPAWSTQLAVLRALVRPGGCLYVAVANPLAPAAKRDAASLGPLRLARLLRGAGFTRVESLYLHPSLSHPHDVVPATRRGAMAHFEFRRWLPREARARRLLAWAGVYRRWYPAVAHLAFA